MNMLLPNIWNLILLSRNTTCPLHDWSSFRRASWSSWYWCVVLNLSPHLNCPSNCTCVASLQQLQSTGASGALQRRAVLGAWGRSESILCMKDGFKGFFLHSSVMPTIVAEQTGGVHWDFATDGYWEGNVSMLELLKKENKEYSLSG